jgi:hydrocephalus-inducing protein
MCLFPQVEICFTLATERIGVIHLPAKIQIMGSKAPPLDLTIAALSKGPAIHYSTGTGTGPDKLDINWTPELNFGNVPVLTDMNKFLYLKNSSLIPAEIKTFITGKESSFWVNVREAVLQPGEGMALEVSVFLDEVQRFKDVLNILVIEGKDTLVPLTAMGTGTTIVCADPDKTESLFGSQYTFKAFETEVVLQNMGRKAQTLNWVNPKQVDKAARLNKAKQLGPAELRAIEAEEVVFSISPERCILRPKETLSFTIRGYAEKQGGVEEWLKCKIVAGKVNKTVCDVHMTAAIMKPCMEISTNSISYVYSYEKDVLLRPQMAPLTLRNLMDLNLDFSLKTQTPFRVDQADWTLAPNEAATVNVYFDPGYKTEKLSHTVKNKLNVMYTEMPHRDSIDLAAEVNYPNLKLSRAAVEFGAVLTDTTKRVNFTLTNVSKVDCVYTWVLAEDKDENPAASLKKGASSRVLAAKALSPSQVYDICPIRGVLRPGESEVLEASYYAHANSRLNATAVSAHAHAAHT